MLEFNNRDILIAEIASMLHLTKRDKFIRDLVYWSDESLIAAHSIVTDVY